MTIPLWTLLGFAVWTLVLMLFTVGFYRWSRILAGRQAINSFRADDVTGDEWYRRAMRAHANCVENLPVFGAIVMVQHLAGLRGELIDGLCMAVLVARVVQSLVHVYLIQTNTMTLLRFGFYMVQVVCFLWLVVLTAAHFQ